MHYLGVWERGVDGYTLLQAYELFILALFRFSERIACASS